MSTVVIWPLVAMHGLNWCWVGGGRHYTELHIGLLFGKATRFSIYNKVHVLLLILVIQKTFVV